MTFPKVTFAQGELTSLLRLDGDEGWNALSNPFETKMTHSTRHQMQVLPSRSSFHPNKSFGFVGQESKKEEQTKKVERWWRGRQNKGRTRKKCLW